MDTQIVLDNIFIFIAAVLVLLMQAGFALVEAGLTQAKNSANIMMKNLMDACVGILVFGAVGFSIAYPGAFNGWFGFAQFGVADFMSQDVDGLVPSVDFLFQAAFAAAAATIVSGAVAGRTQFKAYLVYSIAITALIYPIIVSWAWGGGWLSEQGFVDFAGSGLVHMVGGVAAFMGALIIGPRLGKFKDGKPQAIPGHSMPMAILGVMLLFVGWFGFNPGSELAADLAVPIIAALTAFAAAAGGASAMVVSWVILKKPDVSMAGNGMLAGLVAICSGIGDMNVAGTLATGAIAGSIVVVAVLAIERAGVDDPVGAISVHGICGFWGLVATGLFATTNSTGGANSGLFAGGGAGLLGTQIFGGLAIAAFVGVTSGGLFLALKAAGILRVSREEELAGLDVSEHGSPGYGANLRLHIDSAGKVVSAPVGDPAFSVAPVVEVREPISV
ncbi:MAG: ammonium transporter [Acidimicrobiales bacterium]|nr:ammonium transporter [Acidimicrobiales bacterium]